MTSFETHVYSTQRMSAFQFKMAVSSQFTILGKVDQKKKHKVKRVLPRWLQTPVVIQTDLKNCQLIDEFNSILHPTLLNYLKTHQIDCLFPVQSTVIPWILSNSDSACLPPRDICVSAPTGSGKTLAFALPIIQLLLNRVVTRVRALVVLPVRELAIQVHEVFETYTKDTDLKVALIVGDHVFIKEQSMLVKSIGENKYQSLVDIVIATPGKLVDHVTKTPGFNLSHLRFLVIDEADRMMDEVHFGWLNLIENHSTRINERLSLPGISPGLAFSNSLTVANCLRLENRPQKLLFSATLSADPEKLNQIKLFQPKLFTSVVGDQIDGEICEKDLIGKYTTPLELREKYIVCEKVIKPLILFYLMEKLEFKKVLCFTNSVETTRRLYLLFKTLLPNVKIGSISSNLTAKTRKKILDQYSRGYIDLLISSDVTARGLDLPRVKYVISYDTPPFIKTYIHRVGRTARAGRKGRALSLVEPEELKEFKKMMKRGGKGDVVKEFKIDDSELECYQELYKTSLAKVSKMVKKN